MFNLHNVSRLITCAAQVIPSNKVIQLKIKTPTGGEMKKKLFH